MKLTLCYLRPSSLEAFPCPLELSGWTKNLWNVWLLANKSRNSFPISSTSVKARTRTINFSMKLINFFERSCFEKTALEWPRNLLKKQKRRRNKKYWKTAKPQSERVGEKNKKNILWSTQLRNSKCLTFVFFFYQSRTDEEWRGPFNLIRGLIFDVIWAPRRLSVRNFRLHFSEAEGKVSLPIVAMELSRRAPSFGVAARLLPQPRSLARQNVKHFEN